MPAQGPHVSTTRFLNKKATHSDDNKSEENIRHLIKIYRDIKTITGNCQLKDDKILIFEENFSQFVMKLKEDGWKLSNLTFSTHTKTIYMKKDDIEIGLDNRINQNQTSPIKLYIYNTIDEDLDNKPTGMLPMDMIMNSPAYKKMHEEESAFGDKLKKGFNLTNIIKSLLKYLVSKQERDSAKKLLKLSKEIEDSIDEHEERIRSEMKYLAQTINPLINDIKKLKVSIDELDESGGKQKLKQNLDNYLNHLVDYVRNPLISCA